MKKVYLFSILLTIYTILFIILGFTITGNPLLKKKELADQRTVQEIHSYYYAIEFFVSYKSRLPDSLEELETSAYNIHLLEKTSSSIDYNKTSDTDYELCATFETDKTEDDVRNDYYRLYPYSSSINNLTRNHPAGYHCINLEVQIPKTTRTTPPIITAEEDKQAVYTYKGDSDPSLDKIDTGTLSSKSFGLDGTTVISFVLETEGDYRRMTFFLDEDSVFVRIENGDEVEIAMNDIKVMDNIRVQHGKTTAGTFYARKVTLLTE
jgi:hypothetical protein